MADEYVLKKNVIDALISDKVEITDVHRDIGGERDFEVLNVTCDRHADMVMAIPAADVRPVVRGRWVNGKCNNCGEHAPYWCLATTYHESDYCPNCGAQMDEDMREDG